MGSNVRETPGCNSSVFINSNKKSGIETKTRCREFSAAVQELWRKSVTPAETQRKPTAAGGLTAVPCPCGNISVLTQKEKKKKRGVIVVSAPETAVK